MGRMRRTIAPVGVGEPLVPSGVHGPMVAVGARVQLLKELRVERVETAAREPVIAEVIDHIEVSLDVARDVQEALWGHRRAPRSP